MAIRFKTHSLRRNHNEGTWSCECGSTGENALSAEQHHQTKSAAAIKRLDDDHLRAMLTVSGRNKPEYAALNMIYGWGTEGPWQRGLSKTLRRYLITSYDGFGHPIVHLDWRALAEAIPAGHIDAPREDLEIVRFGCSLMGQGDVNLWYLQRCLDERGLRLANEALRHLFPDNPE